MFIPSVLHHSSCLFECKSHVPKTFGVVCWNVHKNNCKNSALKQYLLTKENTYDFMLFQEASFRDNQHFSVPNFAFDAAANLEIKGKFYGVLTASKTASTDASAYLSEGRESLLGPHKSLLVSHYHFDDGTPLLILNVHAINFRENQSYNRELERFLTLMQNHKGAMIVAGDFNTWNKARMQKLHLLREKLSLHSVPYQQDDHIKSFMGNHLDFIFYRGLELQAYASEKVPALSDHNPLFATFKKANN